MQFIDADLTSALAADDILPCGALICASAATGLFVVGVIVDAPRYMPRPNLKALSNMLGSGRRAVFVQPYSVGLQRGVVVYKICGIQDDAQRLAKFVKFMAACSGW